MKDIVTYETAVRLKEAVSIHGFDGDYLITPFGDIFSSKTKRFLKPKIGNKGYLLISLRDKSGKQKTFSVHRAVAKHFISNPENKPCVNHKDTNRLNCHFENLEWVTYSENNKYSFSVGKFGKHNMNIYRLIEVSKKPVIQKAKDGLIIKTWGSMSEASKELSISVSGICMATSGKLKTYKGFLWSYK